MEPLGGSFGRSFGCLRPGLALALAVAKPGPGLALVWELSAFLRPLNSFRKAFGKLIKDLLKVF